MVDVTSPDNILVSGKLASGGVASVHIASNPFAGSGYRMEIYGREGTLIASSGESPNHDRVRLQGAQGSDQLEDLPIPAPIHLRARRNAHGAAYNVGQMYYQFGRGIREGEGCQPDFDEAVRLHRFIDSIQEASDQSRAGSPLGNRDPPVSGPGPLEAKVGKADEHGPKRRGQRAVGRQYGDRVLSAGVASLETWTR